MLNQVLYSRRGPGILHFYHKLPEDTDAAGLWTTQSIKDTQLKAPSEQEPRLIHQLSMYIY